MFISINLTISSVVIAGAGGLGLEIFDYLLSAEVTIDGFIDDAPGITAPKDTNARFIGSIYDFFPKDYQAVIVAIGSPQGRQKVLSKLLEKGCEIPAFIAPSAIVSSAAIIERGVIICPLSIVNRNTKLSYGALVNVHCSIGHGSSVGKFSVLSPYAVLNGDSSIGDSCFLGTRSTIFPKVRLGNKCVVDSHSYVKASVGDGKIITNRGNYIVLNNRLG